MTDFYNKNEDCLLCGTNWIFKQNGLRFKYHFICHASLRNFVHY
jgi:hypothetical protein